MVQHLYISGKCLLYLVDFPNCCYNLGKFQVIFNNVSLIKPLTRKKKKIGRDREIWNNFVSEGSKDPSTKAAHQMPNQIPGLTS